MLTHEQIVKAVAKAATEFALERVSYFGSYADGNATEKSDLDVLVEFYTPPRSLLTIQGRPVSFNHVDSGLLQSIYNCR